MSAETAADRVRQVVAVVARGWLTVALTTLAGGAGALVVLHAERPLYRSSVVLVVTVPTAPTTVAQQQIDRSTAVTRAFGLAQIATTPPAVADAVAGAGLPPAPAAVGSSATLRDPFLRIDVVDPDPARARAIVGAYVDTLQGTAERLEGRGAPAVRLAALAPATTGDAPVSPGPLRILLPGVAAGLVLGLALCLLRALAVDPAAGSDPAPDTAPDTAPVVGPEVDDAVRDGAHVGYEVRVASPVDRWESGAHGVESGTRGPAAT